MIQHLWSGHFMEDITERVTSLSKQHFTYVQLLNICAAAIPHHHTQACPECTMYWAVGQLSESQRATPDVVLMKGDEGLKILTMRCTFKQTLIQCNRKTPNPNSDDVITRERMTHSVGFDETKETLICSLAAIQRCHQVEILPSQTWRANRGVQEHTHWLQHCWPCYWLNYQQRVKADVTAVATFGVLTPESDSPQHLRRREALSHCFSIELYRPHLFNLSALTWAQGLDPYFIFIHILWILHYKAWLTLLFPDIPVLNTYSLVKLILNLIHHVSCRTLPGNTYTIKS